MGGPMPWQTITEDRLRWKSLELISSIACSAKAGSIYLSACMQGEGRPSPIATIRRASGASLG